MEQYMQAYDDMDKTVVYRFERNWGGIGDYLKFCMVALNACIAHNVKLRVANSDAALGKHIKLRHRKMNIHPDNLASIPHIYLHHFPELQPTMYAITPQSLYGDDTQTYDSIQRKISDVFTFSDHVSERASSFLQTIKCTPNNYISIHLRLGDKHLETDQKFVLVRSDERYYDETKIFSCIEGNNEENILFFCDNAAYKKKIKERYPQVHMTDFKIGHTSLSNTNEEDLFNAVVEFCLLTTSKHIYAASLSGFSIIASKFNMVPLTNIY